jgi:uncharacterized protein (DUF1778 family)
VAVKTHRLEARLSPEQRERIERAASAAGLSVSAFVVDAAVERADEVIAAATSTAVPADYFDELLGALDHPERAHRLAAAAERAGRAPRIVAR